MIEQKDQTLYFAFADCDGHLEIFEDEDKKEHLLGLDALWEKIDPKDYEGFEATGKRGMDLSLRRKMAEAEEA